MNHERPGTSAAVRSRTALAAVGYTVIAAAQKASSFILLIGFTHVLAPTDYGQVALLTTVGALLTQGTSLGLEPRITFRYVRNAEGLADYLHVARLVSLVVPVGVAAVACLIVIALPLEDTTAWVMECVGACLLAAGTTYAYAVLRASRQLRPYATLALSILGAQIAVRIVLVAILDLGPTGWAATDLVVGLASVGLAFLVVRSPRRAHVMKFSWAQVVTEGLPLVPHYLAQWGLAISDRLVLALFVTTAEVGIYSALYQIAAVTSLVLNEVNRAFMPSYAQHEPGDPAVAPLVRTQIHVSVAVFGVATLVGLAVIEVVLPDVYSDRVSLFPLLALGALGYGLYFVPMNALTLVAGSTRQAPVISWTALAINLAVNLALDSVWGLWGAVVGTMLGYATLTLTALWFERRSHAVPWRAVARGQAREIFLWAGVLAVAVAMTAPGNIRTASVVLLAVLLVPVLASFRSKPALSHSLGT